MHLNSLTKKLNFGALKYEDEKILQIYSADTLSPCRDFFGSSSSLRSRINDNAQIRTANEILHACAQTRDQNYFEVRNRTQQAIRVQLDAANDIVKTIVDANCRVANAKLRFLQGHVLFQELNDACGYLNAVVIGQEIRARQWLSNLPNRDRSQVDLIISGARRAAQNNLCNFPANNSLPQKPSGAVISEPQIKAAY